MLAGSAFIFGPFRLDPQTRRLTHNGIVVKMPHSHFNLLHALVAYANQMVTKDQLAQATWPGIFTTDNALAQAVGRVRRLLQKWKAPCRIESERGHGYRLSATVERETARLAKVDLDALLVPHRAFVEGRAALESLDRERIAAARHTFEQLLLTHADDAMLHVGLANAYALTFEATRADAVPETGCLERAEQHAWDACTLQRESSEAWATLGFVLGRRGQGEKAVWALRQAVALEPNNWRHRLRLAYGTWGDERMRATTATLKLLPGCAMAHLLAATVFVARDALTLAQREVDAGLATVTVEQQASGRVSAVALHWLHGLLALARGDTDAAMLAFERELAGEASGHLYARECCASTWYAIGVIRLSQGDRSGAEAAFNETLTRVPRHPMAHVGLAMAGAPRAATTTTDAGPISVDVAMAYAAGHVAAGDAIAGAQRVNVALASAPAGNTGWLLPVEPLLRVGDAPDVWAPVLTRLRTRAS